MYKFTEEITSGDSFRDETGARRCASEKARVRETGACVCVDVTCEDGMTCLLEYGALVAVHTD